MRNEIEFGVGQQHKVLRFRVNPCVIVCLLASCLVRSLWEL